MLLRRFDSRLLCIASAALLAGCSRNVYEIEMRPKGDALERELTAWHEGGSSAAEGAAGAKPDEKVQPLSLDELKRIAAAYGEAVPKREAKKYRFSGTFRGALPGDIGGAGSFTRWQSPLGDLYVYAERCRGNDDLAANLNARRAALDRTFDVLIAWLDEQLKDDPLAAKLHELFDGPVRRDAHNLLLDAWAALTCSRNRPYDDAAALFYDITFCALEYLAERDYFSPSEVPQIMRTFDQSAGLDDEQFLRLVRSVLTRKLKLDDDKKLDGLIALLGDTRRVDRTLLVHLKTTPEYARLVAKRQKAVDRVGERLPIDAREVLDELVFSSILGIDLDGDDRVRAKLHVDAAPFATNGTFDAEANVVAWDHAIDAADADNPGLPFMMYAAWSQPNETEQTRRFGKIILDGEPLSKYVLWYNGLTEAEQAAWTEMLDSLRPGDGFKARVAAFRFPAEAGRESSDPASMARFILTDAFERNDLK
jgi:hypothetical protein